MTKEESKKETFVCSHCGGSPTGIEAKKEPKPKWTFRNFPPTPPIEERYTKKEIESNPDNPELIDIYKATDVFEHYYNLILETMLKEDKISFCNEWVRMQAINLTKEYFKGINELSISLGIHIDT